MKLLSTLIIGALFLCPAFSHAEININTATEAELITLKNIGPAKAAAIVQYREQHGHFASLDDLLKVQGIGMDTLEKNRSRLTLESVKPSVQYETKYRQKSVHVEN